MKMLFPLLVLAPVMAAAVAGCGRRSATAAGPDRGISAPRPVIALVVKTLNNPYFIDMQRGAGEAARAAQVDLIVQGAEREIDVERQMEIIENLIQRRVNALIIAPSGSREIVPVIVEANRAGIPVLIVDTRVDAAALQAAGGRTATFIGSDNYEGGRVAGEFLVRRMRGDARVAVLEGIPGHETGDARLRGFRRALESHPGMVIVASQPANWERDQGYNVCQNLLQAHPEMNAVFAANDMMALGAVEAIAAAGRAHRIVVVGFDAVAEARAAVKQGTMAATVAQDPAQMGRLGVETAAKILHGGSAPAEIGVPIQLIK